jgi:hypothetical protein
VEARRGRYARKPTLTAKNLKARLPELENISIRIIQENCQKTLSLMLEDGRKTTAVSEDDGRRAGFCQAVPKLDC